jgi:hypothetical protein
MEPYWKLRETGINWRLACYIAWASSPKIGRVPATQEELAKQVLGLTSDRVIATWRKRHPEIEEIIGIMQAAPLMDHRADVFRALAVSAADTDHRSNPDRRLFLELTGDYVPKQKVEVGRDADDLSSLSDAELDNLARQAMGVKHGKDAEDTTD